MKSKKIQAVQEWPAPTNVHEACSFHGFATCYRRFIKDYSSIVSSITDCIKKGKFTWDTKQQASFDLVKDKFDSCTSFGFTKL